MGCLIRCVHPIPSMFHVHAVTFTRSPQGKIRADGTFEAVPIYGTLAAITDNAGVEGLVGGTSRTFRNYVHPEDSITDKAQGFCQLFISGKSYVVIVRI